MASISIDRKRYRANKASATWLDKWLEGQIKESQKVTKTIKDKEVTSEVFQIVPWKLFQLVEKNGFKFEKIREQVEAEQIGAIGRARMILAGNLKRKIAKGEVIKDIDGNDVPQDEAFLAYKAELNAPHPTAPAAAPATDEAA